MKTQKKLWSALAALCVATGTVAQPAYNYSKLQKEQLGRGVVAIRENPSDVVVSWRYLSSDPMNTSFNVYRNGEKIAEIHHSYKSLYDTRFHPATTRHYLHGQSSCNYTVAHIPHNR